MQTVKHSHFNDENSFVVLAHVHLLIVQPLFYCCCCHRHRRRRRNCRYLLPPDRYGRTVTTVLQKPTTSTKQRVQSHLISIKMAYTNTFSQLAINAT